VNYSAKFITTDVVRYHETQGHQQGAYVSQGGEDESQYTRQRPGILRGESFPFNAIVVDP
jgi:hypothetical protein